MRILNIQAIAILTLATWAGGELGAKAATEVKLAEAEAAADSLSINPVAVEAPSPSVKVKSSPSKDFALVLKTARSPGAVVETPESDQFRLYRND